MSEIAIGIDLGGTNVRACLVSGDGRRLAEQRAPVVTGTDGGTDGGAVVAQVRDMALAVRGGAAPSGLGLAVGGALDGQGRLIAGMSNLPALVGRPVAAELSGLLGMPVVIENDARAAMLGEARFGAARGVRDALFLTLGTGIGGGLLLDGRVRVGPARMAGEIGLVPAPGADGTSWVPLEDMASPGGLRRTRGLEIEAVAAAAAQGDAAAAREIGRICELLALAIISAHVTLDLERVVLAGGMMHMGAPLIDGVRAAVVRLAPPAHAGRLTIVASELGPWMGAMGAAALILDGGREPDPA